MDDVGKTDKLMMETFSERLKFDVLQHHVILYTEKKGFEYNYLTNKIRPFNSILWYPLNNRHECDLFAKYLKDEIEREINIFEESGYPEDYNVIGLCTDGYIIIDIEETFELLQAEDPISLKWLRYSCEDFQLYIMYLYRLNEEAMKSIIDKHQNLL